MVLRSLGSRRERASWRRAWARWERCGRHGDDVVLFGEDGFGMLRLCVCGNAGCVVIKCGSCTGW